MKLITLNTWGGRVTKELFSFLNTHREVEVFCFQEIYHKATYIHVAQGGLDPHLTLFDDIEKILQNHNSYFRPHYLETYGLAMFVRKDIEVLKEEGYFVHKHRGFIPEDRIGNHARNVQTISLIQGGSNLHIFNFHGLWNGGGKNDSEDRLKQSRKLSEYIKNFSGKKVLCGDFNLLPDTQSLNMIAEIPMRNLVKDFGVTSTRTSYYEKDMRFADYIFVNDEVKVNTFKVLPDEVSDHSPSFLDFD